MRPMDNDRSGIGLSLPVVVALSSALLERSTKGALIIVGSLNLASGAVVPHGFLSGAQSFGAAGTIPSVTLGQPFAAPPVTLSDGSELRSGFQEAAEAHITF